MIVNLLLKLLLHCDEAFCNCRRQINTNINDIVYCCNEFGVKQTRRIKTDLTN